MIATYPNLPLGVTEADEYAVLQQRIPWLFTPTGTRRLLYIGANQLRPPHHAQRLKRAGWQLHLMEIFLGNVQYHAQTGLFDMLTLGDVRCDPLPPGPFDVAVWWHGIEHVAPLEVAPTVARLETTASLVVLGCPHGFSPQDSVYGNDAERHLWDVYPTHFRILGYQVVPYSATGTDSFTRHHLLAWKGEPG